VELIPQPLLLEREGENEIEFKSPFLFKKGVKGELNFY
jgi:hypothetical protein